MIDSLVSALKVVRHSCLRSELGLEGKPYAVLTLHRPSNVDNEDQLRRTLDAIDELALQIPVVFPAHPRTARNIEAAGLTAMRTWKGGPLSGAGLWMMPPASYLDFLDLMQHAVMVITDSGGVQEETTFLGVPCLTYRETTERPVTVSMGTNRVVGCDPQNLLRNTLEVLGEARDGHAGSTPARPPLWDGRTSSRIAQILKEVWEADLACAGEREPR
jgi:UDP-N-acetylglucosamine 2-epimerase (non-hydrolysing)